jgi:hypothetical protein
VTDPTYSQIYAQAVNTATQVGIDPSIFLGLIQQESSFNINASPGTTSAYGLTQLVSGTAKGLGVNQYDWQQNLLGGATYLKQQLDKFGNYQSALSAYYSGPGNVSSTAGQTYASQVIAKASAFSGSDLTGNVAQNVLDKYLPKSVADFLNGMTSAATLNVNPADVTAASKSVSSIFPDWNAWFTRGAFLVFALIFIAAALFTFKGSDILQVAKGIT